MDYESKKWREAMFVDMNMHEMTFSSDSEQNLEDIVKTARARGLDAICITDHDSMGLKEYAENYSREVGFPIFVGVEYYSLQGDILAYGIDTIPDGRIDAQDFIDYVNERGGVTFACHPFRNNNRGLEDHLSKVEGLTGIEVLNGSTLFEANQVAYEYCDDLGLMAIGAGDSHHLKAVGRYATWLPNMAYTTEGFVQELKKGISIPAIPNKAGGYTAIDMENYFRPRLVAE